MYGNLLFSLKEFHELDSDMLNKKCKPSLRHQTKFDELSYVIVIVIQPRVMAKISLVWN